jgi:hypothetical protein
LRSALRIDTRSVGPYNCRTFDLFIGPPDEVRPLALGK